MISIKKSFILVLIFFLIALITSSAMASEVIALDKTASNDDDLHIVSIAYKKNTTVLKLEYILKSDPYDIGIYATDNVSAFVITDVDHKKRYKLLSIDGIAVLPKMDKLLKEGDKVAFTLVFEKMPLREFDMFEGYVHNSEYEFWHFDHVKVGEGEKHTPKVLKIKKLTDDNFLNVVKGSNKLVAVKFWASWCGACKSMKPKYKAASRSYDDRVVFATMNTEHDDVIPTYLKIEYLPTTILFKNGQEVSRAVGAIDRIDLLEWMNLHL